MIQLPALSWLALALGACSAAAYGFYFLNRPPTLLRALLKAAPVASLAFAAGFDQRVNPLAVALILGTLGNFALAFEKTWTRWLGLVFFLLAHLLYFLMFLGLWIAAQQQFPMAFKIGASVITALCAIAYFVWIAPKLRWFALGAAPYALALCAMAMMSYWIDMRGWAAMLGAPLFLISNGLRGARVFRPQAAAPRFTAPAIWWTYAAAQALLAYGISHGFVGMP